MGLKKGQTHSSSSKKSTENEYHVFRRYFVFSCVDILLIKDDSVLLTRRTINPHKGSWHLPGSIIRKNETMRQTVRRTAKKELNINVKIKKYIGTYENLNSFRHDISHGFLVSHISGKFKTDFQSNELRFFKKIPKNTVPHHKKMIKNFLKS
jgi:ADP-ribose pyrophosphatase YjhB (NUDIX family)